MADGMQTPDTTPESMAQTAPKIVAPPAWNAVKKEELEVVRQRVLDLEIALERVQTSGVQVGGVSGGQAAPIMEFQAERDRTDAKIEAAEARVDTKFALTNAKLDALMTEVRGSRIDGKTTRIVITTTMIGSVLALAALMYALVSYGSAQFYNGTTIYDHLHPAVTAPQVPSK